MGYRTTKDPKLCKPICYDGLENIKPTSDNRIQELLQSLKFNNDLLNRMCVLGGFNHEAVFKLVYLIT